MGHSVARDTVKEPPDVVLARLGVVGAGHPPSDRRDFASFEPARAEASSAQVDTALPRVDVSRVDPRRAPTVVRPGRSRGPHLEVVKPSHEVVLSARTVERRGVAILAVLAACALVLGGLVLARRDEATAARLPGAHDGGAP
jgi:hypothetical protein